MSITTLYECARCGKVRPSRDMARVWSIKEEGYALCHPGDATGTTCYMRYSMGDWTP